MISRTETEPNYPHNRSVCRFNQCRRIVINKVSLGIIISEYFLVKLQVRYPSFNPASRNMTTVQL